MQESFRTMLSNLPESSLIALSSDGSGHLKQALVGLAYLVEAQGDLISDQQEFLRDSLGCGAGDEIEGFSGRQEVLETHLEFIREGKAKIKPSEAMRGEVVSFPVNAMKRSVTSEALTPGAAPQRVIQLSQRREANRLQ